MGQAGPTITSLPACAWTLGVQEPAPHGSGERSTAMPSLPLSPSLWGGNAHCPGQLDPAVR